MHGYGRSTDILSQAYLYDVAIERSYVVLQALIIV